MYTRRGSLVVVVGLLLFAGLLVGCSEEIIHEPPEVTDPNQFDSDEFDSDEKDVSLPPPEEPQDDDPVAGEDWTEARLSDAEKQARINEARLYLLRMFVSTEETSKLSSGEVSSTEVHDALQSKLAEMGFKVIQSTRELPYDPSEQEQDSFRVSNDCNLALVSETTAKLIDSFGNFHRFEAEGRGKVLNLTTHRVIAAKRVTVRGKRSLNESDAADDAHKQTAKALVGYLTDQTVSNPATSLVRMTLVVQHIEHLGEAQDIRFGVQKRPGVWYVSLEQWSQHDEIAVYEVLCRYDVSQFLSQYVEEARPRKGVEVKSVNRIGEVIHARRQHGG